MISLKNLESSNKYIRQEIRNIKERYRYDLSSLKNTEVDSIANKNIQNT